ncbi:Inner centromere protein [Myotis davidii]|uniref:Inner centromere protein n=1 Tax=Myotis davidii TaxID=225400 RepID=L5LAT6_MYODS|nr:Inner centromere protein [Myotis davidii]
MGTTAPGPVHLLELCDQKLMEFVCNVDNKHLVWLEEIEEEAKRMFTRKPKIVPRVEIGVSERHRAEQHVSQRVSARAPSPAPSDEESTPKKPEAGRLESVAVSSLMATPQDPKGRGVNAGRSASKLRIARTSPGPQDAPGSPASPWQERVLVPILPDNLSTPKGALVDRRSVRRSLIAPSSPGPQNSLAQKYSLVDKPRSTVRKSNRLAQNATKEPAASARIICHSYLERLLNVEVPQKVSPEEDPSEEAEPVVEAEPEVPKIVTSTPGSQPAAGGQDTPSVGQREAKTHQTDGPMEPPPSVRRKRSYKQAVSELDEEQQLDEDELQPPRSKTPSPPCPASKEKERQRLEQLRRKEEAEQLRRQKVEEAKRQRLEEVKLKREERLRKVLQARERAEPCRRKKIKQIEQRVALQEKNEKEVRGFLRKVLQARERAEQMKEEKKKQIEQKLAQLDEKTEKAKEERLAEEKAKKKAAAKKMEEMEARRKQEEEARRLRRLQQPRGPHRPLALSVLWVLQVAVGSAREQQEREKALRLQRELEEKKKKEEQQRLQEEQEKKAREAAAASKGLNTTVDVQSPACTSYQMTPQGHRAPPKINPDNYGMDLNSDDSTDDESHPRKPIPSWARGAQLSQAILHQYYHPPNLLELFGTIRQLDLEDIFKKSKPRYHKRTSSAVWNSPPLPGPRVPSSLTYSLKKF